MKNTYSWIIPNIVEHFGISSEVALFLLIIKDFSSGAYGYCYQSQEFIAERMDVPSESIFGIIKEAKGKNLLQPSRFGSSPGSLNVKQSSLFERYLDSTNFWEEWINSKKENTETNGKSF